MKFLDKIKKFFNKNEIIENKEFVEDKIVDRIVSEFNERDSLAIEISKSLYNLYTTLENENKKKICFFLKIKDEVSSKNCSIDNVDLFIQRIRERKTTVGYELLVSWINGEEDFEEYNDINKILIKIYGDIVINIDYQYEIDYEMFNIVLGEIENIIKNKFNKSVEINYIKRIKPIKLKEEFVDFGILGKYSFNNIEYRTEEQLNEEQIKEKIREILTGYSIRISEVNRKIFYEMHYQLSGTDYNIWDYEGFDVIFDREKLPVDFDSLTSLQKMELLYVYNTYDYNEVWEKIQELKPFWNLDKIKDDINITSVVIEPDYKKICIEFNGFCSFFYALVDIDYEKYEIRNFDPS